MCTLMLDVFLHKICLSMPMSSMYHLWAYKMLYVVKCLRAILISNAQNTCIQTRVMQVHQNIAYNTPPLEVKRKNKRTTRVSFFIFVLLLRPIYTS